MFKTSNFYQTLFENHSVSNVYGILGYLDSTLSPSLIIKNEPFKLINVYSFELFPAYLKYNLQLNHDFKLKKTKQKLGFAVNLKDCKTINDFLKSGCSSQHRKNVIRAVNRLESCFDVSYKTYFGDMPAGHYTYIMQTLKNMIVNRFQEREGRNKTLKNWNRHVEQTLHLIRQKRASIFVIYDTEKPIEISINYHVNTIMYSSISSFNLNYSKFSLGNIEIYKQLEWCLLNNIHFFDMGYGDFDYKRKWANHIYDFENHIFYHKYNLLGPCFTLIKTYQYKAINYLISKKVNDKIYSAIEKLKTSKRAVDLLEYELKPLASLPIEANLLKPIDFNDATQHILRKPVYDCLYKYQEHISNIRVYEILNSNNRYFIQGKHCQLELVFNEHG